MEDEPPLSRAEAQALLRYAEATYRATTASQRRIATAALALTCLFALITLVAGVQALRIRAGVDDVADRPLVEALGVQIADPRPFMERAQLRIEAVVLGVAAAGAGLITLLCLAVFAIARPPGGLRGLPKPRAGGPGP